MKLKSSAVYSVFFFASVSFGLSVVPGCGDQPAAEPRETQESAAAASQPISLFDGTSFAGWEGDTAKMWKIEDGAIVGGSLTEKVQKNDFLCTTEPFGNFDLRLKFKLEGTEGFVNSGVQFHSVRATDPPNEMVGYQADLGNGWWGGLYDETRRNKTLALIDSSKAAAAVKPGEWNDYRVRAQNGHIQIFINDVKTVDYTEEDASIPQSGLIGFQIHGGGKALVRFKDIYLEKLPD